MHVRELDLAPQACAVRQVGAGEVGQVLAAESTPAPVGKAVPAPAIAAATAGDGRRERMRPRYRSWAELMRQAFEIDVLACPTCGGRMILLATITDPAVIRRILTHLGRSLDDGDPSRAPPWADGTSA